MSSVASVLGFWQVKAALAERVREPCKIISQIRGNLIRTNSAHVD